jgi:hypothetical protein
LRHIWLIIHTGAIRSAPKNLNKIARFRLRRPFSKTGLFLENANVNPDENGPQSSKNGAERRENGPYARFSIIFLLICYQ